MLHFLQIVLYLIESVDALLEMAGQAGEQRRDFRVLEMLELGDDVVALLAGFYPVHEILRPVAAQTEVIDALRKHARKEECVISNMLANLALAIERRRGTIDRIGFDQHLAYIGDWLVSSVAYFEQLLNLAELGHEMRDVVYDLRVANPNLLGVVPANQLNKQLLQRMRFRNHRLGPPNSLNAEFLSVA